MWRQRRNIVFKKVIPVEYRALLTNAHQRSIGKKMLSLPTELLVRIFRHFCAHPNSDNEAFDAGLSTLSDQPGHHSLASLCLVSRHCRNIAQVLLYRDFVPRSGSRGPGDPPDDILRSWNAQVDSFVRTITKRRDLAALVKRVTFNAYFLQVGSDVYWTHPLMTVGFVASRLPNLEQYSLDFRGSLGYKSSHFKTLSLRRRPVPGGPPPIDGSEYFFGLLNSTSHVGSWDGASLHTLNLRMPTACDRSSSCRLSTSPRLRIETLRVAQSGISPSELEGILSSCTDLRTFIYEAGKPSVSQLADFNRTQSLPDL